MSDQQPTDDIGIEGDAVEVSQTVYPVNLTQAQARLAIMALSDAIQTYTKPHYKAQLRETIGIIKEAITP